MAVNNLTKFCPECKLSKPLTEFYKNRTRHDGVAGTCRLCSKERRDSAVKQCSIPNCVYIVACRGLCSSHYSRLRQTGQIKTLQTRLCSIEGCDRKHNALGLCVLHYNRLYERGGDPTAVLINRGIGSSARERFWSRVTISNDPNRCWVWNGTLHHNGYGRASLNVGLRTILGAHRLAFYYTSGKIPTQMIRHTCDRRSCCNPNHLIEGTHKENMEDMVERNRSTKGSKNPGSKLNEDQVTVIKQRLLAGESLEDVTADFPVAFTTIWEIWANKRWTHVPPTMPGPRRKSWSLKKT